MVRKKTTKPRAPRAGKYTEPPSGGREVKTGQYHFWNPEGAGDTIQGTLAGTVTIKNQRKEDRKRWTILVDKTLYVLPDHLNLDRLITDVEANNGSVTGVRVWIQYLGKKEIEGVDTPMAQYRLVDYGKS